MFASLLVVALIGAIAWAGSAIGLSYLFGVVLPYVAVVTFFLGVIWRMVYWAKSPVPFSIPTTGGQEKSLDFIKHEKWDCPNTKFGVVVRMFLEVCFFRSLFRNTAADVREFDPVTKGPRTIYYSSKWLWFFALLFHYCFLLARRLFNQRLRYISLMNDYFPLFLILGVVLSGICMRYFDKTDIAQVKVFIMGLVHFSPVAPDGISPLFFMHLAFVSVLLLYFPFSKLMHMPGVFFSPTRNLPTNTREVRHVNPWNPPKQYFTYAEYEDVYRDAMAEAGLPLEKQPSSKAAE